MPDARVRVAAVIGGLATACGIALTATAGWLIVAASHQPVILTLLAVIVAVRAFGIARPVLRYVERVRSHDAALEMLAERRVAAYRALIPLTPARLGRRSRSEVLTGAVEDLEDEVFATVRVRVPVLGAAVAGVLAVLVLGALVPIGAIVVALVLLGHAAIAMIQRRMELAAQRDWLAARAEVARVATLVTSWTDELRGLGAEAAALDWVEQAQRRLVDASRRLSRARAAGIAAGLVVTAVGTALAALVSGWAMTLGLPDAVAAIVVLAPLAVGDALVGIPDAMTAWARARGSHARLHDLLDQPPAVHEQPRPGRPAETELDPHVVPTIELDQVGARWLDPSQDPTQDPAQHAAYDLAPVSLRIAPGEHLVLTGANGSGKSTLLAVLARHLDPATGSYRIAGHDVQTLSLEQVRALIAVVDDEPHIFASSVRENLRLARTTATDDELVAALGSAGLREWLAQLPEGLDTMLGTGARGVSGGERARLALARAHLSGRPIVLLDEPVAHLDHATAVAVLADVCRAFAGRTVVLVSHRPDGLEAFERVVELRLAQSAR